MSLAAAQELLRQLDGESDMAVMPAVYTREYIRAWEQHLYNIQKAGDTDKNLYWVSANIGSTGVTSICGLIPFS